MSRITTPVAPAPLPTVFVVDDDEDMRNAWAISSARSATR